MIEQTQNFLECEAILSKEVTKTSLLGQLDLTEEDLDVLTRLIRQQTGRGLRWAVRYLEKNAPTCLACFLVGMGTYGYQKHSFWSPVMEALELDPDPAYEQQLGGVFLRYLDRHHLTNVEIPGSLKFVTPILFHGGIPNICLPEYFEELVLALVRRDGIDPTDPIEITQELAIRREIERERVELNGQYKALANQIARLKKDIRTLHETTDVLDDYIVLKRLESTAQARPITDDFPDDFVSYRAKALTKIETIEGELSSLTAEAERLRTEPQVISEQDNLVLSLSGDIESCIRDFPELEREARRLDQLRAEESARTEGLTSLAAGVLSQPWSNDYCDAINVLPHAELADRLERLATLEDEHNRLQSLERQSALPTNKNKGWVAPVLSISGGTGLLVIGLLRSSFVPILPGVTLFTAGCWLAWNRYQQTMERNRRLAGLAQQLITGNLHVQKLTSSVGELLGHLPIQQKHLSAPSLQLLNGLSGLAEECKQLASLRSQRTDLEQSVLQRKSALERTAAAVKLSPRLPLEATIDVLAQTLEEAKRRHEEERLAIDGLQSDLQAQMSLVEARIRLTKADLSQHEVTLEKLANGQDVGQALDEIAVIRQQQQLAAARRRELEERYPDLATLEPVLERVINQGTSKLALEEMTNRLSSQVFQLQREAEGVAAKLDRFPSVFPGIDEPIRRYILYGGDPAEQFLINSLRLIYLAMMSDDAAVFRDTSLPDRVKSAFEIWWSDWRGRALVYEKESEPSEIRDGSQLRKPYLLFDAGAGEIVAAFPAQQIFAENNLLGDDIQVNLTIAVSDQQSSMANLLLRVYRLSKDLFETEMIDLDRPPLAPSGEYHFSLTTNGRAIRRWTVPGLVGDPPWLAFGWQRYQALVQDVPAGNVWLLTKKGVEVKPKQSIIEEIALFGQWRNYRVCGLDLAGEDYLELVGEDGAVGRVPIATGTRGDPEINASHQVQDVLSDGLHVYSAVPELTIPGCTADDLMQWRVSILPIEASGIGEPRHYRLSELAEAALVIRQSPDLAHVQLGHENLLGPDAFGAFEIRVRKSLQQPWTNSFVVVPNLSVKFAKPLYLPSETGQHATVNAAISLDDSTIFEPLAPSRLISADQIYRVETQSGNDSIIGSISPKMPAYLVTRVPISIQVPRLRWRLDGIPGSLSTSWSNDIQEIWLGDWESATELSLVVSFPVLAEGTLRLGLSPAGTESQVRTLRRGKARFDLLAFGDSLRRGSAVQAMVLTADNQDLLVRNAELFKVRTRWEVQEIECIQEIHGRTVVLKVTWMEFGKTDGKQRVVRLWRVRRGQMDLVLETDATDGTYALLEENVHILRPGSYLVEVALIDPWSTTIRTPPKYGSASTQLIEVTSVGDIRQGERFRIRSIWDDQNRLLSLSNKSYRIQIVGKIVNRTLPPGTGSVDVLITRSNEGWYVGELEVEGAPELAARLETTNPVKFQYVAATDQLSAVEDHFGEGAMYCNDCKTMFWSQETNLKEQKAGHELLGPIEVFKITWESQ